MRIGVKFCGNCNPRLDTPELVRLLATESGELEFVRWDDRNGYAVLLVLNSCQIGCATFPNFAGPCIVVTNECVQHYPVREADMPAAIVNAIRVTHKLN